MNIIKKKNSKVKVTSLFVKLIKKKFQKKKFTNGVKLKTKGFIVKKQIINNKKKKKLIHYLNLIDKIVIQIF